MQNLALLRKQIVINSQPVQRSQMAVNDRRRRPTPPIFAASPVSLLDVLQRLRAIPAATYPRPEIASLACKGPSKNNRISVAAVSACTSAIDFLLEMQKSQYYVRYLYAGVINIVLNLHAPPRMPQQAAQTCRPAPHFAGARYAPPYSD